MEKTDVARAHRGQVVSDEAEEQPGAKPWSKDAGLYPKRQETYLRIINN